MTQKRFRYNLLLAIRLLLIVIRNPHLRFSQILSVFGYVKHTRPVKQETADTHRVEWKDEFYLEPKELSERVSNRWNNIKNLN
jgi:hypothetical protein